MTHGILDIVAEDPEEEHVARNACQPPCRNMEVSTVDQAGTADKLGAESPRRRRGGPGSSRTG